MHTEYSLVRRQDDSKPGTDDEETNDQKDSADKAENAPSVSTPSDMEDTTVPGGNSDTGCEVLIFSWSGMIRRRICWMAS